MGKHSWDEVADRIFRLRCPTYDLNVVVVAGDSGLLLVDTRSNMGEARELRADLSRLSGLPVRWVVNTHVHYDHTFGNAEFVPPRQVPGAELWAHANAIAAFPEYAERARAELIEEGGPEAVAMAEQVLTVPRFGFAESSVIDVDGRRVELDYHGRGHTDGDLTLRVPDAGVVIAGDLIRQSGPPAYWADCFPLEWPATVQRIIDAVEPGTRFVPGHGDIVELEFVRRQQADLRAVADEIVRLHAAGIPEGSAVETGRWPHESPRLPAAVHRGYTAMARRD